MYCTDWFKPVQATRMRRENHPPREPLFNRLIQSSSTAEVQYCTVLVSPTELRGWRALDAGRWALGWALGAGLGAGRWAGHGGRQAPGHLLQIYHHNTRAVPEPYMRGTCVVHAQYMRGTCVVHAQYMRSAGSTCMHLYRHSTHPPCQ
jgi:hypothetical protein